MHPPGARLAAVGGTDQANRIESGPTSLIASTQARATSGRMPAVHDSISAPSISFRESFRSVSAIPRAASAGGCGELTTKQLAAEAIPRPV